MFTPDLMRQNIDFFVRGTNYCVYIYIYIYITDFVGQNTDFSSEQLTYRIWYKYITPDFLGQLVIVFLLDNSVDFIPVVTT